MNSSYLEILLLIVQWQKVLRRPFLIISATRCGSTTLDRGGEVRRSLRNSLVAPRRRRIDRPFRHQTCLRSEWSSFPGTVGHADHPGDGARCSFVAPIEHGSPESNRARACTRLESVAPHWTGARTPRLKRWTPVLRRLGALKRVQARAFDSSAQA